MDVLVVAIDFALLVLLDRLKSMAMPMCIKKFVYVENKSAMLTSPKIPSKG